MKTEDPKKYEEWLTTIANTRLIYNTMDELERIMDNRSIHSNGIKRCFTTPQKLRAAFRDLKEEVSLMTENVVNLERSMTDYKRAWDFFRDNLARRSDPAQVALELLRYCYPPFASEGVGKKKLAIFEAVKQNGINVPFLVLMLLKVIPGYDSKDGDVVGMSHKYEEVMIFMEKFTEGNSSFSILPAITKARGEEYKSRLMLMYHVSFILETYESYIDNDNLYSMASDIKESRVDFDIEGCWNECDGKLINTDFWYIEPALNYGCYFATHWHKDANNKLTGTCFSMFFVVGTDGRLISYMLHPEAIKNRMKGLQYGDVDQVWYVTDMPKDYQPTKLRFSRYMASSVWQLELNLTKVTDESTINTYNKWFDKCVICKPFGHLEYTFVPNLYAITESHLYIPSENEGEYYKIPRHANEGFAQIQLSDQVGTMTMGDKTYLAFDELLLYIPVTNKQLKRYGITIVDHIE